jgi:hypothetical protein
LGAAMAGLDWMRLSPCARAVPGGGCALFDSEAARRPPSCSSRSISAARLPDVEAAVRDFGMVLASVLLCERQVPASSHAGATVLCLCGSGQTSEKMRSDGSTHWRMWQAMSERRGNAHQRATSCQGLTTTQADLPRCVWTAAASAQSKHKRAMHAQRDKRWLSDSRCLPCASTAGGSGSDDSLVRPFVIALCSNGVCCQRTMAAARRETK